MFLGAGAGIFDYMYMYIPYIQTLENTPVGLLNTNYEGAYAPQNPNFPV